MSLQETPAIAPKKKRKTKARRKRAASAPKPAAILTGITATVCPAACSEAGCVISGKNYCAHPHKGGLQGLSLRDDGAVTRFAAAKKALGKTKVKIAQP